MSSSSRQKLVPWALFLGVFACGLAVAFWGLSGDPVHADKGSEAAPNVLAKVGDTEITESEVEELVASEMIKIRNDRYQALQKGLNDAVADRLIDLEAAARGVSREELIEAEVTSKAGEVTEGEIDAFYEARKDQIRAPKENVVEQIRQYLAQQRGATIFTEFIGGLEDKYGVERYLSAPRIEVASEGFPAKGAESAQVTIVEFSDFECPYCARVLPSLDRVMEEYGDSVRLVFRQFPLNSIHPRAQKAAEASLCAADQGKFWEMHDAMFADQKGLTVDQLKEKAAGLELDSAAFDACLDDGTYADRVAADLQAGAAAGVTGTPAMFVNGLFVNGAVPYEQLAEIIDKELERADG